MSRGRRYTKIVCPHCGEKATVESSEDEETIKDWMDEYGWYWTRNKHWVCPDCYECEGLR